MSFTWPGEGLLIKLWETLAEKGVGGLLKPGQTRREGLAKIDLLGAELVALADAEREAEAIRSGRMQLADSRFAVLLKCDDRSSPQPNSVDHSALHIATAALIGDTLRREVNVAKAIKSAEEELKNDTQPPPEKKVDSDWLYRWRDLAGNVSADTLQAIWGRLLAGEVKTPGTFSLRTLEFVKNLTTSEALLIEKLCQFIISDIIIRDQTALFEKAGLTYRSLIDLQSLGIISGVEALGMSMELDSLKKESFFVALASHNRVLLVSHADPTKKLKIAVDCVSPLGQQLLRLGKFTANEEYLQEVAKKIALDDFTVSIADCTHLGNGKIQSINAVRIQTQPPSKQQQNDNPPSPP